MKTLLIYLAAVLCLSPCGLRADLVWKVHTAALAAGPVANTGTEEAVMNAGVLSVPAGQYLRVYFDTVELGLGSRLRLTSLADGHSQTLDAAALRLWENSSAMFNGDAVQLDLLLAPGDSGISVRINKLKAARYEEAGAAGTGEGSCCAGRTPKSLCGPDDRVASTDNRAGRINGNCTAWLVSNGGVLTAGHCGTAAGHIFEVNIPASQANGSRVLAAPQDQFPVVAGSVTVTDTGNGNDWAVFRLGANANGQFAHRLHGFYRMTRELPGGGQTMRITGCGIDNAPMGSQPSVCGNRDTAGNCTHFGLNAQNQTLQTSTGGFGSESGSGSSISLTYAVDTEPANSGSPVIWEATGFTIGIHTNGGCTSSGGSNLGTSFENDALEAALAAVPGAGTRYLDFVKAPGGAEDGTVFQPHDTLTESVNALLPGMRLAVTTGNYTGAANRGVFIKPMTFSAPVGPVTFGN